MCTFNGPIWLYVFGCLPFLHMIVSSRILLEGILDCPHPLLCCVLAYYGILANGSCTHVRYFTFSILEEGKKPLENWGEGG
jgi:hypothetical protein